MAKPDENVEIVTLTPDTIPNYAAKTGRDEEGLLREYRTALAQDKVLFGFTMSAPYWMDYTAEEKGDG